MTVKRVYNNEGQDSKNSNLSSAYEQLHYGKTGGENEAKKGRDISKNGSQKYMDMSLSERPALSETDLPTPALGHEVHYSIIVRK